jgi:hypothetical protein
MYLFHRPEYKLLFTYDILPEQYDPYFSYIKDDFVPALHTLGMPLLSAWFIVYGDYPARQIEFACPNVETLRSLYNSPRWTLLEKRLQSYTIHYQRKLVHYEDRFQF